MVTDRDALISPKSSIIIALRTPVLLFTVTQPIKTRLNYNKGLAVRKRGQMCQIENIKASQSARDIDNRQIGGLLPSQEFLHRPNGTSHDQQTIPAHILHLYSKMIIFLLRRHQFSHRIPHTTSRRTIDRPTSYQPLYSVALH